MKVFISQPMRGKTEEFIKTERTNAVNTVCRMYPDVEILDTYFEDFNGNAAQFLGKSIMKLGEADLAVFLSGWDEARGCLIEQRVCRDYGIKRLYL